MSRKSWAEEMAVLITNHRGSSRDLAVRFALRKAIEECARRVRGAFVDMDNGTSPKSACRIAAADILALLGPGDEGGE